MKRMPAHAVLTGVFSVLILAAPVAAGLDDRPAPAEVATSCSGVVAGLPTLVSDGDSFDGLCEVVED
ncbi:hypothetical protein [Streptomyces sp. NPDC050264]|uniref:hypothetical protein n=1 Tax=Streptomyces sp. NPDC050264 TaxID=3155038 RepID=UPI003444A7D2